MLACRGEFQPATVTREQLRLELVLQQCQAAAGRWDDDEDGLSGSDEVTQFSFLRKERLKTEVGLHDPDDDSVAGRVTPERPADQRLADHRSGTMSVPRVVRLVLCDRRGLCARTVGLRCAQGAVADIPIPSLAWAAYSGSASQRPPGERT
jgi:hypothetical protein